MYGLCESAYQDGSRGRDKIEMKKCIAFACQQDACYGTNLCPLHTRVEESDLAIMKEELQAIRNYACVLMREAENLQSDADEALKDAKNIHALADRKENQIAKLEMLKNFNTNASE